MFDKVLIEMAEKTKWALQWLFLAVFAFVWVLNARRVVAGVVERVVALEEEKEVLVVALCLSVKLTTAYCSALDQRFAHCY